MAIRYDNKLNAEIKKVVNAYNSKIRRLTKANKGYILPEKFSSEAVKSLKETSQSRKELRRRLKDLQSFTARGGEKSVKVGKATIPQYKLVNIKRYQRLLKIQTTRKIKELETRRPTTATGVEPYTFSQYGSQEYLTLRAKRFNLIDDKDITKMSSAELESYFSKLKSNTKEINLDVWKDNFINIIQDTALSYDWDDEKLEKLIEVMKKLSPSDIDDLTFINRNFNEVIYKYAQLKDIQGAREFADVSADVRANFDSIYENLTTILEDYFSEAELQEIDVYLNNG